MQKYEYYFTNNYAELAKLGAAGWELVAVDNAILFFKRPMQEAKKKR